MNSSSNGSPFSIAEKDRSSLLNNFNMQMKKIQLEHANLNTKLALQGPG